MDPICMGIFIIVFCLMVVRETIAHYHGLTFRK